MFYSFVKIAGEDEHAEHIEKIPILIKPLAFLLPIEMANRMPWCPFPGGRGCFPLQAH